MKKLPLKTTEAESKPDSYVRAAEMKANIEKIAGEWFDYHANPARLKLAIKSNLNRYSVNIILSAFGLKCNMYGDIEYDSNATEPFHSNPVISEIKELHVEAIKEWLKSNLMEVKLTAKDKRALIKYYKQAYLKEFKLLIRSRAKIEVVSAMDKILEDALSAVKAAVNQNFLDEQNANRENRKLVSAVAKAIEETENRIRSEIKSEKDAREAAENARMRDPNNRILELEL